MSGELAHLILLIGAFDTGGQTDRSVFPFNFVESTTFELFDDPAGEPIEVADAVADWLRGLRRRGVQRLLAALFTAVLEAFVAGATD